VTGLHGTVWLIVAAYGALSLITFIVYACDKRAARRSERRIAERILHLLDLIGGWPGGWLAQRTLRHKCSKLSFQRVYWLTALLNAGLLAYLLFHL
jgi:uncharacterized membrane protein YsdA (DUF1294 family)